MTERFGITAEATEAQMAQIEALRTRLNSEYGTDNAHWMAAAEMVMSGILDEVKAEALAPLRETSDIETMILSDVMAADVWNSRGGRSCDYTDLSPLAQRVQRDRAQRHLEALRRFLAR